MMHVPELVEDERATIPAFSLGSIEYRTGRSGNALSAASYMAQMQLPELAVLRHAYFDRASGEQMKWHYDKERGVWEPDHDDWISPEYRQDVLSRRGRGEWTSTILHNKKECFNLSPCVFAGINAWLEKNYETGEVKKEVVRLDAFTPDDMISVKARDVPLLLARFRPDIAGYSVHDFAHFPEGRLPSDGWVLEYDKETGFPRITGTKKEAQERFGDDA